jgi:HEAT repeat protein
MPEQQRKPSRKRARPWVRWLLFWAVGAAVGGGAAMLTWFFIAPHVWFHQFAGALDAADEPTRQAALARIVAEEDPRRQAVVVAALLPWLDDSRNDRFLTAFDILGAYGALPRPAQNPLMYLRHIRLRFAAAGGGQRATVLESLETLRGIDVPQMTDLLIEALGDAEPDVRRQAVWAAMRFAGRHAPDVLLTAVEGQDAEAGELAALGLPLLDGLDAADVRARCRSILLARAARAGPAALRCAALHAWAACFAEATPEAARQLAALTADADLDVAAAAVGLLDLHPCREARVRVAGILADDAQSPLTTRAAMAAGALGMDEQAPRLVHWVYKGESADLRVAAAASLGPLDFPDKAGILTEMLTGAALEPGTTLDIAVLAAMRESWPGPPGSPPPQPVLARVRQLCSMMPTDVQVTPPHVSATSQAAVLARQPMVANEAARLLAAWDPAAARPILHAQIGSPFAEVRDRAAVALGRIADAASSASLRKDLSGFNQRRRSAASLALAVAGDAQGLDRIEGMMDDLEDRPQVAFYFRTALWIGGRRDARGDVPQLARLGHCPPITVIRPSLLAGSPADALRLLLGDEQGTQAGPSPKWLDSFFQSTRVFELLGGAVPGWGGPVLSYRPAADAAWREAQCRRLTLWYHIRSG